MTKLEVRYEAERLRPGTISYCQRLEERNLHCNVSICLETGVKVSVVHTSDRYLHTSSVLEDGPAGGSRR